MKKLFIAAIAVFAFSVTANAQDMKFGIKAGVDLASAKVKFGGASASDSETGFFVGGLVNFNLTEKLHLQPEILYVAVKDLDQIHIPITFGYHIAEKFNLLAGPTLSFIMDTPDGIKSLNYGVDLGAGFDLNENMTIDLKYNLGLANLVENGDSDNSYKLGGVYIGFAYKF